MSLDQTASKGSEEVWIAKYRAALDQKQPEISGCRRIREFIAGICRKAAAYVTKPTTQPPESRKKKSASAVPALALASPSRKIRQSTVSSKKTSHGVKRGAARSKASRASNK
ncbi:MAG: hypothetical protein WBZ11_19070 [Candidatus Sulfotelmatobacter sp.]|jgi:hypothetical protein